MGKVNIIKSINGMNDILPDNEIDYFLQSGNWLYITDIFREMAGLYGYEYIETPEVEVIELFKRTSGVSSDIVRKEMYSWEQGDITLCLRPEGSASTCRAVIQSNIMNKRNNLKVWYRGGMFRHERPQFGRYRRHVQLGIEFYGEAGPMADAEIIYFLTSFYKKCGLSGFKLHLNSVGCPVCRSAYRQLILDYARPVLDRYCEDCKKRFEVNPMRILDCKSESCRQLNAHLPKITENLCEECSKHLSELKEYLDKLKVDYVIDSTLVRGLDYYTRTVFEVILDEAVGPMKTLSGGGRYDGLFECIGGKSIPAVGFGIGIERLLLAMEKQGVSVNPRPAAEVYIACADSDLLEEAFNLAIHLRELGIKTQMQYDFKKLKKQLSEAVSIGSRYCVILGRDEWENGQVKVKNMATYEQWDIALSELDSKILGLMKNG